MNKKSINFSKLAVIAAMSLYLFGFSTASLAEEAIARVIVSSGHFSAIQPDGKERVLKRRSAIFEGDTLVTAEDGRAQIRFKDGALIDIQAATQLRLDEYNYQGKVDGSEKNTMSLIKGGFRTITGVVGKKNKKNYKVNTPVATIGIRGTHYGLHYCGSDCGVDTGNGQFQNKKGLYGGVVDGAVVANNDSGEIRLGNDEYFYVASKSAEPQVLLVPPAIIFKGSNEQVVQQEAVQETDSTQTTTDTTATETTTTTEEVVVPDTYDVAYSDPDTGTVTTSFQEPVQPAIELVVQEPTGDTSPTQLLSKTTLETWPIGTIGGIAFSETGTYKKAVSGLFDGTETSIVLNSDGDPISFYHVDLDQTIEEPCNPCTFNVNGGVDATADSRATDSYGIGVTWGRWDSGNYVITENGNTVSTGGAFNFIYSSNITSDAQLSLLTNTSVQYLAEGAPSIPTGYLAGSDTAGTPATINFAVTTTTMGATVDFLNQEFTAITYNLTTSSGDDWNGNMDGGPTSIHSDFIKLTGDCQNGSACTGVTTTSGMMSADFVGSNAEGLMTTYDIKADDGSTALSGVGLLIKQP
jgi:hypothetical protein